MPTGYTAGILDGKINTFPEFAKVCMRAFGATMHMRDQPLDAEYEPEKPSDYHQQRIKEAESVIAEVNQMSDEEVLEKRVKEIQHSMDNCAQSILLGAKNNLKMRAMVDEVRKWQPPTSEHEGLKKFMLEQLSMTLQQDGDSTFYEKRLSDQAETLKSQTPQTAREYYLSAANKEIEYHSKELSEDIERCGKRNKWVEDLIHSL